MSKIDQARKIISDTNTLKMEIREAEKSLESVEKIFNSKGYIPKIKSDYLEMVIPYHSREIVCGIIKAHIKSDINKKEREIKKLEGQL